MNASRFRIVARKWLWVANWLSAGCSSAALDEAAPEDGSDLPSASPPEEADAPGCTPDGAPECLLRGACDVREARCQQRLLDWVQHARGEDSTPQLPQVQFVEADAFDEEPPIEAEDDPWLAALQMLNMVRAPEPSSAGAAGPAAYYDRATQSITVRDGDSHDSFEANYVLAHELVHAVRDQEDGLSAIEEHITGPIPTLDRQLAATCLIEGEAMLYAGIVVRLLKGSNPREMDWLSFYDDMLYDFRSMAGSSFDPLGSAAFLFPYALGGRFLSDKWSSTEGYSSRSELDSPLKSVADYVAGARVHHELSPCQLPGDYSVMDWNDLGLIGEYALLLGAELPEPRAWELAKESRGNAVTLGGTDDSVSAVVWRALWSSAEAAQSVATVLRKAFEPERFAVEATDSSTTFFITSEPRVTDREGLHELCE